MPMDSLLCDELLQEIIQRLPPSSSSSVSLVSKRWLSILRRTTTSLSLPVPNPNPSPSSSPSFSSILSHYPFLSSLTIESNPDDVFRDPPPSADSILLTIAQSGCAPRLTHLRLPLIASISPSALLFSSSFTHLTALHLSCILPLCFRWLTSFPSLKSLSVIQPTNNPFEDSDSPDSPDEDSELVVPLPLETLSLTGIRASDSGLSWLWRRCSNLRKLQLRFCDGTGDGPSSPSFPHCLPGLQSLELRICRRIANRVLLRAADHCTSLTSFTLYDGANRLALHHFITRRGAGLHSLDLRLPLDLDDNHILAIAASHNNLTTLRLKSCCLVTGDGLRSLAGAAIEELALVNCDVVEREPGLLSFLGQSMPMLRSVDLSYNDMVADKEVIAMLISCRALTDIRLRGCERLTDASVFAMIKSFGTRLEFVDLARCPGITIEAIEILVSSACKLREIHVEENKVSVASQSFIWQRGIQVVSSFLD
ncbi:hypothetical protein J5N97_019895 [Dioscorea zingiberensis]|uniref:F-box domain-containing protein n=1 Tax=Dioscorea zingiberensis TaxID=325984 RepID=A0A9D5CEU5_9LILI|nr:hypothetical protein J5N97_019895 [Dioscorea zingiberensis]